MANSSKRREEFPVPSYPNSRGRAKHQAGSF
jgi:hypothetical protein